MSRKIISAILAGIFCLSFSPVALAFTPVQTAIVSATATCTGTIAMTVVVVDANGATYTTYDWGMVDLNDPAVKWRTPSQTEGRAIKINYLLGDDTSGRGILICTTNAGDVQGLIGLDGSNISTSWRVTDTFPNSSERTVYEKVIFEGDIEVTTGLDLNGVGGVTPGITLDVNGDGDIEDYLALLSDRADAYLVIDTAYTWPDPKRLGRYPCYLWMLDDGAANVPYTAGDLYEDASYATIVDSAYGIQHAENTFGDWNDREIYVGVGANFGKANVTTYSANLTVQLYAL